MILILSGKQGSGKSSIQAEIQKRAREKFEYVFLVNFADPLYVLHDFILNKMESAYGVPKPASNKDGVLLQLLGTEWGRKVHGPNIWVDIMKTRIANPTNQRRLFIIADCRFENEFHGFPEALRVRLYCDEAERKLRTHGWRETTNHASEIDLDKVHDAGLFDLYINTSGNNITIEGAASLILAQLDKNSWVEKREKIYNG